MAVEAKRGCGFRKVGGLYLVGGTGGIRCDRLPIPLTVCPCCSHGIKQTRGWTWVDIPALVEGNHVIESTPNGEPCNCSRACPLCYNVASMGKGGLLWIGAEYYPSIEAFELEASIQGVSRRVSKLPRNFKLGETWVLFAHPKGIIKPTGPLTAGYIPAIFRVWKPERIERFFTESDRGSADVQADVKRGITPVFVPDTDTDHCGGKADEEPAEDTQPNMFSQT